MLPTLAQAQAMLQQAGQMNPGPWTDHSHVVADCARKIAARCPGMDADKAYLCGLLHDIGRRYGVTGIAHVIDGYRYLLEQGFDETARICLTHSFADADINTCITKIDISDQDYHWLQHFLQQVEFDDYDRLIQLCDSIALAEGPTTLTVRMDDVLRRYGNYPQSKRDAHFHIKYYFEQKMGSNIYTLLGIDQTLQHQELTKKS